MMIGKDAILAAIDKERQILIEQGRPGAEHIVVYHARRLIEEAPTVDAIPVSWICRLIRDEENTRNYKTAQYLTDMIWKWHQEADDEDD